MSDGMLLLLTLIWMAIVSPAGVGVVIGLVLVRDACNGVSADVGARTQSGSAASTFSACPLAR